MGWPDDIYTSIIIHYHLCCEPRERNRELDNMERAERTRAGGDDEDEGAGSVFSLLTQLE